ncbi:hypothetical protein C0995_001689 [Termitomyces sp. Mi166|nr:hypothetical protein C0995_001689 [Termitomyces sp. Mi166\
MGDSNQIEHEQISTSLEVEQLDSNLFRSKSLWVPTNARGVFGGQVISQALVSATNCVSPAFGLHSLHCYFLLSASPSTAIIYHVDRVRQGRSYVTISVRANQNGRVVFVLMCSFQKPEPWQPSHQWPMPHVPGPEHCEDEEVRFLKLAESPETPSRRKKLYQDALKDRLKSPIAIKRAKEHHVASDGTIVYMYWMQARNIPKYEAPFQKYLNRIEYIRAQEIWGGTELPGHDCTFLPRDQDQGEEWYTEGYVFFVDIFSYHSTNDQMYTRNGNLVAVTSQEGVVRANVRADSNANAKL